jgi:hypothetical protein
METIITRDVSIQRLGFGTFRMTRYVGPPFAPDWNALTL